MSDMMIRDIPEGVYAFLRRRAKARGHSLNAEVRTILADRVALERRRKGMARALPELRHFRERVARKFSAAIDSAELIRESRDAR